MPSLLLLCEYPSLNGGEHSMLATLSRVRKAGFLPSVAAPPNGPLTEKLRSMDVKVVPFLTQDGNKKRLSQGVLRDRLASILKDHRPDLLHANSLATGRLAGPVANDLKIRSIAHLRDIIKLSTQAVSDLNLNTRLIAVSNATYSFHVKQGLNAQKTFVAYNGVDLNQFRPRPATGYLHEELGLPNDAILIGAIGQIGIRKGLDLLSSAAVSLADRLPKAHYVVVGKRWSDKEESRRFEADLQAVNDGTLAGRFHLVGVRTDVDKLLNELTLLVHSARQEPLGRVLLEAASAGVAIVATDVGGTKEIFPTECGAATLVPPNNATPLADAIYELVKKNDRQAKLAVAARRRAEKTFDIELTTARLIEHYRQVIDANSPLEP